MSVQRSIIKCPNLNLVNSIVKINSTNAIALLTNNDLVFMDLTSKGYRLNMGNTKFSLNSSNISDYSLAYKDGILFLFKVGKSLPKFF